MHYYLVATSQLAVKNQDLLTYHYASKLPVGQIVVVPLGKKLTTGVIFATTTKPNFITKEITTIVDPAPLPRSLVKTLDWISQYYCSPLPQVLKSALPTGLTKKRRFKKHNKSIKCETYQLIPTPEQRIAIDKIIHSNNTTTLLHGITGSGKTTIYLEVAKQILSQQKSVIIIVPEIALTAQLINQFESYFEKIVLLHSGLTEAERHINWQTCLNSTNPVVVIGARSAIFAPVPNLGLVVIDEFHESSLKQDKNPRYQTSRVAAVLAKHSGAKLILGSATPPVADYWLAQTTKNQIVTLTKPARAVRSPQMELIDMTKKSNFSHHSFLSNQLLSSIKNSLAIGEQALIFHNRRGSSSATICRDCGWVATCPKCDIPLILHHDYFKLVCHLCGHKMRTPLNCPACQSSEIDNTGIGTKLIEREVRRQFPKARVARFDADSSKLQTIDKMYQQLVNGEVDILIGTQVITKGLNLPNLSTVGIVQADAGLSIPDYITQERNFQQIAQVVGRVGRDDKPTRVIVQTYQPQQASIRLGLEQNYQAFYQEAIEKRRQLNYPPFTYLLKLKVAYKTEASCISQTTKLANQIKKDYPQVEVIGPAPAFYEKLRNRYNWQLIIKSKKRTTLQNIIKLLPNTNWQYDIDPESLL